MPDTQTRDRILAAVKSFPAMSTVTVKVLHLLRDQNSDYGKVEGAIRYDPGLTANVLKLANSAYFGLRGQVSTVRQAISFLGWKRMYHLVMASTVNGMMQKPLPGYDLAGGELWQQAVAAAVAAESVTKDRHLREADECFTAALLRDVGKLVMGEFVESFSEQIELAVLGGVTFETAEREILGTDHAEVGAWILDHWSLPDPLCRSVRWHHDPDRADPLNTLTDVVHIADALAMAVLGKKNEYAEARESAMGRLEINRDYLKDAETRIVVGLADFKEVMKTAGG